MKTLPIAVCAALLAAVVPAQVSGSINQNAPVVAHSITMGPTKLELTYSAIRFGQGAWQKILENTEAHEKFNTFAEKSPIGSVKTNAPVMAAGHEVPAGEYTMFFTVSEQAGWVLNLKPKTGESIRWRLVLTPSAAKNDCLKISLDPTAQNGTCSLTIAFGSEGVTVPVVAQDKPADKKKDG